MSDKRSRLPVTRIDEAIYVVRGHKVMLDSTLADLYGVETRALVQAMKRNTGRFPVDFVFQLTSDEYEVLRSQIVISKGSGGRRYSPYVFTEHGAIMPASVVNSERAIEASVYVVRAFVRLREMLVTHKAVAQKLSALEKRIVGHDKDIQALIDAIRQLTMPPSPRGRRIGFEK